jgi:hypothetical protein
MALIKIDHQMRSRPQKVSDSLRRFQFMFMPLSVAKA